MTAYLQKEAFDVAQALMIYLKWFQQTQKYARQTADTLLVLAIEKTAAFPTCVKLPWKQTDLSVKTR